MNEFDKMAQKLNDAMMNPEGAEPLLREINEFLHNLARKESGVRADELSDENREQDPIVLLYWMTLTAVTAKLYMRAAQGLYVTEAEHG